jgi:hypothetical protein
MGSNINIHHKHLQVYVSSSDTIQSLSKEEEARINKEVTIMKPSLVYRATPKKTLYA